MGVTARKDVTERSVNVRTAVAVTITVLVIVGIQLVLPDSLTMGRPRIIPLLELLGLPLGWLMLTPQAGSRSRRIVVGTWAVLLVIASIVNALLLLVRLVQGGEDSANTLLFSGFGVLAINILSFGLIFWWLDGGGPPRRSVADPVTPPDFLFPQQQQAQPGWLPRLGDYYYTAYTNAIAFSPTDTMPMTQRAKLLFTIQSAVALLTITVTLSTAVNLFQ